MTQKVTALVPMRHHSERVPGKNYRSFAGRPLYHHILEALLSCPLVSKVVIDTDSGLIKKEASRVFPQAVLIDRPAHLTGGSIPMNQVLLHDLSVVEGEFFLQTHSTNPLLSAESITRAIEDFFRHYPGGDSLFSVTRLQTRLWDGRAKPLNHDPGLLLRTQDLDPVYEENSCLYIFSRKALEETGNRLGGSPRMFELDPGEAWDIDEELDFRVAEFLYNLRRES